MLPDLFYNQAAMRGIMNDASCEMQRMRPVRTMAGAVVNDNDATAVAHIESVRKFLSVDPAPTIMHQQYAVMYLIYCSATLCETLRQNSPPSIIREWLDGNGTTYTLPDFCTRFETTVCGEPDQLECSLPMDHVIRELLLLHLCASTPPPR